MRPDLSFVRTKFWTDGGADGIARYANFCTDFLISNQSELQYHYRRTKGRTSFRMYSNGSSYELLFVVGVGDVDVVVVVPI